MIRSVQVEEPEAPKAPEVPKAQKGLRGGGVDHGIPFEGTGFIDWASALVPAQELNTTCSSVAHQEMQHESHQSLQPRKPWLLVRIESIRHRGFEYFLDHF